MMSIKKDYMDNLFNDVTQIQSNLAISNLKKKDKKIQNTKNSNYRKSHTINSRIKKKLFCTSFF